ncbi:MAG: iron chelate uptake ABC transporter family permease subunit, partial [Dysgonamonadaceae bacterium]|nr:iron chelate uptake ABC transporter family permease subunit [Dysgonamonadaceae bacterium]
MKSNQLRWGLYLGALIVIVIAAIVLSLSIGEITIPFKQLPTIFSQKDSMEYGVLFYIRIPRTLLGFAVGGSLSLAGAILQGIYRNPLVEPYTLGISGGASLGVTFVLVAGLNVA